VLSIVNGAIKTRAQTYFDDFAIPEDPLYKSVEQTIASRAKGEDGRPRGELMPHCHQIVANITAGKTGKIWLGQNAAGVKFATTWLPTSWMVWFLISFSWRSAYICQRALSVER
jgi:1-acylglycerone phosphate reductase